MKTLRLNPEQIEEAAGILGRGGLVAFPTETVYGLGANALSADAVKKIFTAKERPAWDPVIVHLPSLAPEWLELVVRQVPGDLRRLSQFIPGPLTLLFPKSDAVPGEVTAGRDKVGVRVPAHTLATELITRAGVPIAAPSANHFGRTSPTTAEHVLEDLDGRIDAVLDGGACPIGVESTVLDVSVNPPMILRQGGVTREQLEGVLGRVEIFRATSPAQPGESLPAPGCGIKHYAPRARVLLVESVTELHRAMDSNEKCGLLLPAGYAQPASGVIFDWGASPAEMAQRLFAGLRWLDAQGVTTIIVPLPQDAGLGSTIRERLYKAAL